MNHKSSNNRDMDKELDILSSVQKVEINDDIFDKILNKIDKSKPQSISLWLKMAAAIAVILLMTNFYIIMTQSTNQMNSESTELVPNPSNQLYNE